MCPEKPGLPMKIHSGISHIVYLRTSFSCLPTRTMPITVRVQFGGGLELLFSNQRDYTIELPALVPVSNATQAKAGDTDSEDTKPTDVTYLLHHLRNNLLQERAELFMENGSVYVPPFRLSNLSIVLIDGDLVWQASWHPRPHQRHGLGARGRGRLRPTKQRRDRFHLHVAWGLTLPAISPLLLIAERETIDMGRWRGMLSSLDDCASSWIRIHNGGPSPEGKR
jgi:hypothetical protein